MATLTFSVSDMHLGRGNKQDNFRDNDDTFEKLCTSVTAYAQAKKLRLVSVLNGDIFDLWEIVPGEELADGPAAYEAIFAHLLYPLTTNAQKRAAATAGERQLQAALQAHRGFARGLKMLLAGDSEVHYVFGNHDHAMVQPDLQAALRALLGPPAASNLLFEHFYHDAESGIYFEHGNQLAGEDSCVADPTDWWSTQAAGFYFLRLIWNRLENIYGLSGSTGDQIRLVIDLVLKPHDQISRSAKQYLVDYFRARQALNFPLAPAPGDMFHRLYDDWEAQGQPSDADRFQLDLLHDFVDWITGKPVDVMRKLPAPAPERDMLRGAAKGLPGRTVPVNDEGVFHDAYWRGARARFRTATPPFPQLQQDQDLAVFLGHTHEEVYSFLLNEVRHTACRYLNTGTWSRRQSRLAYGFAQPAANIRQRFGLMVLP